MNTSITFTLVLCTIFQDSWAIIKSNWPNGSIGLGPCIGSKYSKYRGVRKLPGNWFIIFCLDDINQTTGNVGSSETYTMNLKNNSQTQYNTICDGFRAGGSSNQEQATKKILYKSMGRVVVGANIKLNDPNATTLTFKGCPYLSKKWQPIIFL